MKPSNTLLHLDKRARLANMGLARAQRPAAAHLTTAPSIDGMNGYLDHCARSSATSLTSSALHLPMMCPRTGSTAADPLNNTSSVTPHKHLQSRRTGPWSGSNRPSAVAQEVHTIGMDLA
jgi:hypothetical protein